MVAALTPELTSPLPQARAQALHTISKLNDSDLFELVTSAHLLDDDDEAARTAWRAAARMVPPGQEAQLAQVLYDNDMLVLPWLRPVGHPRTLSAAD